MLKLCTHRNIFWLNGPMRGQRQRLTVLVLLQATFSRQHEKIKKFVLLSSFTPNFEHMDEAKVKLDHRQHLILTTVILH